MVLQGIAPSWIFPLCQGSKSEHTTLCAVKCVLKSWRILMFLVNLFRFILSLKFCIFFIDLQFLLQPFHILYFLIILISLACWPCCILGQSSFTFGCVSGSSAFVLFFVFQMSIFLLPTHLQFILADSRIFFWINISYLCA